MCRDELALKVRRRPASAGAVLTLLRFNPQAALVKSICPSTPEQELLSLQVRARGSCIGGRQL